MRTANPCLSPHCYAGMASLTSLITLANSVQHKARAEKEENTYNTSPLGRSCFTDSFLSSLGVFPPPKTSTEEAASTGYQTGCLPVRSMPSSQLIPCLSRARYRPLPIGSARCLAVPWATALPARRPGPRGPEKRAPMAATAFRPQSRPSPGSCPKPPLQARKPALPAGSAHQA